VNRTDTMTPLLSARISAEYPGRSPILSGCEIEIGSGEIFALAGESGSGKSTFALSLLRLLDGAQARLNGHVHFEGQDLFRLPEREMRRIRGRKISLVPQSPIESLNPALRIGAQMREAFEVHCSGDWRLASLRALGDVRLPACDDFLRCYPRQLSVGMAQRVLIAMAILHRPPLVIADESTSALDVITQAEVLELLRRLQAKFGMSILFITHDLLAAARICHRIAVLHQGRIVESGSVREVFERPRHPYTQSLVAALPVLPWSESVLR